MKYLKTLTIFTLFLLFPFFTSQATGLNYCTYEFEYELPTSLTCEDNVIDVTLKGTGNEVCTTYTNVRISFTRVTGPGDVIFKATDVTDPDNPVPYTFTNSGFWGPPTGFPVTWNYEATTPFTLDFTKPGEYIIQFSLIDINNSNAIIVQVAETLYVDNCPLYIEILNPMTHGDICPNTPVGFSTNLCSLNVRIDNQTCGLFNSADYTFSYSPSFLIEQHETYPWLATLTRAIRSAEYYLVVTEKATGRTGQALAHTVNVLPYNVITTSSGTVVNRFKAEEMPSETLNLFELALGVYVPARDKTPAIPGIDTDGKYRIDATTAFLVDFAPRLEWEEPTGFNASAYAPAPDSRLYGWIIILNSEICEADRRRINVVVRGNEIIVDDEEIE